jgi:hypothetical protein
VRTQLQGARNEEQALTRHQICWHLGFGLPKLPNFEQQICIAYKLSSIICYSNLNELRHPVFSEELFPSPIFGRTPINVLLVIFSICFERHNSISKNLLKADYGFFLPLIILNFAFPYSITERKGERAEGRRIRNKYI